MMMHKESFHDGLHNNDCFILDPLQGLLCRFFDMVPTVTLYHI